MEIEGTRQMLGQLARRFGCALLLAWLLPVLVLAQAPQKKYTVKHGKMYIELSKQIRLSALDSFITQFDLSELGLKNLLFQNSTDSLRKAGWHLEENNDRQIVLSKSMSGQSDISNPLERIALSEELLAYSTRFPAVRSDIRYGYNKFKNKVSFPAQDSVVTFYLRNHQKVRQVMLAGSFNNWDPTALAMTKTDSGWIAPVKLGKGKFWYKFILDGDWITDPDNQLRENDDRGNTNSVYYKTNWTFKLPAFPNARRVYLSGSFNDWRERELLMNKTVGGWELPLYLADGTHTYRFIVDGQWYEDPTNKERYPNEFGEHNSVIRLGKPHVFRLPGHLGARQVVLAGSFNGWREDELYLSKTATGWEIPYTLGPGNYAYKFKVDRKWMVDPTNPPHGLVENEEKANSYLIIQPNFTFRLKGFPNAKSVYLAGDFNDWDPQSFAMKKEGNEWVFQVHLPPGKTRYKFIVNGEWIL
ncbi:MAG: glycogen-binding domain-containing protein, partial [Rufibacter sp.]